MSARAQRWVILIALLAPGVSSPAPIGDIRDNIATLAVGDWTPDTQDTAAALDALKRDFPMGNKYAHPFSDYRFQSFGIVRDNTRIVLLIAFCSSHWKYARDWRQRPLIVMDGGECFFHAEYSMKEHRLLYLDFNGR